jgi:hypothetical protein
VPAALLCQFPHSEVSLVGSAMYCAIFLHGASLFGCAPIFHEHEASGDESKALVTTAGEAAPPTSPAVEV